MHSSKTEGQQTVPKDQTGPQFIQDSYLAEKILTLLEERGTPLSAAEIARQVFGIRNLTGPLSEKMVALVLEKDVRFRQKDGRWMLSDRSLPDTSLRECPFVVVDVEITGSARSPHIIEIAALRLEHLQVQEEFHTFVNPGRPIPAKELPEFTVNTALLEKAPAPEAALPEFLHFLSGDVLVAHNAHFDLRMINRELKRQGHLKLANPVLDTLMISRRLLKGVDAQNLPALAHYFNVPLPSHHLARDDARALARIFARLVGLLEDAGFSTLRSLEPFLIVHP